MLGQDVIIPEYREEASHLVTLLVSNRSSGERQQSSKVKKEHIHGARCSDLISAQRAIFQSDTKCRRLASAPVFPQV